MVSIREKLNKLGKKIKGKRNGQSYGKDLPEGWYIKGGKAHKFDPMRDRKESSSYRIRRTDKAKWRGDFGETY